MELGRPFKKITFSIKCEKTVFDGKGLLSAEDEIKMYGLAINILERVFWGEWVITEKGYITRWCVNDLSEYKADIEVENNLSFINNLSKFKKGKKDIETLDIRIHFHFENGTVEYIKADEDGFYLESMKRK